MKIQLAYRQKYSTVNGRVLSSREEGFNSFKGAVAS